MYIVRTSHGVSPLSLRGGLRHGPRRLRLEEEEEEGLLQLEAVAQPPVPTAKEKKKRPS